MLQLMFVIGLQIGTCLASNTHQWFPSSLSIAMVKQNKRPRQSDLPTSELPITPSGDIISQELQIPIVVDCSSAANGKSPFVAAEGVVVPVHSSVDRDAARVSVQSGVGSPAHPPVSGDIVVASPGCVIIAILLSFRFGSVGMQ